MRTALGLSKANALAIAICCSALTGCPQLLQDDFRVVEANAGASSTGASSTSNAGVGGLISDVGGAGGSTSGGAADTGGVSDTGGTTNTGGATTAGGLCTSGQFAKVEIIKGLNVNGQLWGPTLSPDGLTLFFEMYAAGSTHIYVATRTNRGATFSPPAVVPIQGTDTIQAAPFLSSGGLNLYFAAAAQSSSIDRDIWVASRTDTSVASFSNAEALHEINSTSFENRPWVSNDELTILFVSNRPKGMGDYDIWSATRLSRNQPFSPPTNVTSLNTPYRDESPIMSNDGLTVYFTSTRLNGSGKHDIWTATRSSDQGEFSSPTPLKALNSTSEEWDPALSHDEAELFFASDLSGAPELWRATRDCAANEH